MSSLQSSLAQRRIDTPSDAAHVCHSFADAVGAITFTTWQSGIWVLPWVHFLGAHHVVHAKGERIDFLFAQHEVKAEGLRLVLLMPGIAAGRLATLSEVPERFATDLPLKEPCVLRLLIKTRTEIPGERRPMSETSLNSA